MRAAVGILVLTYCAAAATVPAYADSTVTVSAQCTLPDAVAYADGTAEPSCASGTASGTTTITLPASAIDYTVSSTLSVTGPTIIQGGGASDTVISGGGTVEVLDNTSTLAISGVTITDGATSDATTGCTGSGHTLTCPAETGNPGGAVSNTGTLTLSDDVVSDSKAAAASAPVTGPGNACDIVGCQGFDGTYGGNGGGIYNDGTLTISGSTITGNKAGAGGNGGAGVTALGGGPGEQGGFGLTGGLGGGIFNDSSGVLIISDSTISDNTAGAGGNGGGGSTATTMGDAGGNAGSAGEGGSGGGIFSYGTFTITDSTISGNETGPGGNGAGGGNGDGASAGTNSGGGNGGDGGGINEYEGPSASATNVTVTNNKATIGGASGGSGAAVGTGGGGGAIFVKFTHLTLTFATIADNTAAANAGAILLFAPAAIERDSVIASNGGSGLPQCNAPLTDGGGNIDFGDSSPGGCPGTNVDPRLQPVADNGGPTETMALGAGSGAIGAAPATDCASTPTDQRGISRPAGGCDAGAYQHAPPTIASPSANATSETTATVIASISPNLSVHDTMVTVDYGTTNTFGSSTAAQGIGDGDSAVPFTAALTGLAPGTTYFVQIVATNGDGSSTASAGTFMTAAVPPVATLLAVTTVGTQVSLKVSCTGSSGTCSGPIALTAGGQTVGSGSYAVPASITQTVSLPLNSTGATLLMQRYKLTATIALDGVTQSTQARFSYAVIDAKASARWSPGSKSTSVKKLTISGVPSGATVEVICHGGGCPFGKRSFTPRDGTVVLATVFKHRKLKPTAKLELEITGTDDVGQVTIFTIRKRKLPSETSSCLPPGAAAPTRCA